VLAMGWFQYLVAGRLNCRIFYSYSPIERLDPFFPVRHGHSPIEVEWNPPFGSIAEGIDPLCQLEWLVTICAAFPVCVEEPVLRSQLTGSRRVQNWPAMNAAGDVAWTAGTPILSGFALQEIP
jgi:hypothetical protein